MATSARPVIRFDGDDRGYLDWLAAHPGGFVLNCHRRPVATYLVLHRADCTWINPPRFKNWTTVGYIKVCSEAADELDRWAGQETGGRPKPCPHCMRADGTRPARRDAAPAAGQSPGGSLGPRGPEASGPRAPALNLASGLQVSDPLGRLLAFCREEYAYYDGIADAEPDRIVPVDVLATIAMNSFIDKAIQVRRIHRELATRCDPILPEIPVDADLLSFDPDLAIFGRLIHAAVQAPDVLVPRAVKVLHRKRRGFIPMLDTIVLNYYFDASGRPELRAAAQEKRQAAQAAAAALAAFREDLRGAIGPLEDLGRHLAGAGFPLTPVRMLEILVWTEVEPQGYYRRGVHQP